MTNILANGLTGRVKSRIAKNKAKGIDVITNDDVFDYILPKERLIEQPQPLRMDKSILNKIWQEKERQRENSIS